MPPKTVQGKNQAWHHISVFSNEDATSLVEHFKFHPLDIDDIREETELPKIDVYKYYVHTLFIVPSYNTNKKIIERRHFALFLTQGATVTAAVKSIPALDQLFERMGRNNGLKKELLDGAPGLLASRILETTFRSFDQVLRQLLKEARELEAEVYHNVSTRRTTTNLSFLRRNVLWLKHLLKPQRRAIKALADLERPYVPDETRVYFENVEDQLDQYEIIVTNLSATVDSLFEVNEAFIAHRTNDIVRTLTIMSVTLMPPTLVASFYGMNVSGLPWANSPIAAIIVILLSGVGSLIGVVLLIRRRNDARKA